MYNISHTFKNRENVNVENVFQLKIVSNLKTVVYFLFKSFYKNRLRTVYDLMFLEKYKDNAKGMHYKI